MGLSRSQHTGDVDYETRQIDLATFKRDDLGTFKDREVDVLFLCHAIFGPVPSSLMDLTGDQFIRAFQVNCVSHHVLLKQLISNLRAAANPIVVMLISKGGLHKDISGKPSIAYRTTKSAQIAYGLTIAESLNELGIRFVLMNPGWVKSKIGGKAARMSPTESATSIKRTLDSLPSETSSAILNYDGSKLDIK